MKVGKITALALTVLTAWPVQAQTEQAEAPADSHLYYQAINRLHNLYDGTDNPVSFSYNTVQSVADARAFARFENGRFRAVDEGRKNQTFGASIYGLQRFGKLSVCGSFEYLNAKDFGTRWNNTLFVTDTNPFVLGDEISSDVNTESFDMSAAASFRFSPRFTGALSLRYLTGSRSDQTDPRPKTNAMHFDIRPGIEYRFSPAHRVGLSAGIDLFRSDLSHTIVNNNNNYVYYVMKGMGDFLTRTSSDLGAYPRDYKGSRYDASLQYLLTPKGSPVRNLFEVRYAHNKEVSEDGGYAFTYKSGDYYRSDFSLYDRLCLHHSARFAQQFTLRLNYGSDSGDWYDQKKVVNTEHGNAVDYIVLNQSTIRESQYLHAEAGYQADFLRDGRPDLSFRFGAAFDRTATDQHYTRTFHQEYQTLQFHLGADKYGRIGALRLSGHLNGYCRMQLGDPTYDAIAKTQNDISATYVAHTFEYATAAHAGFEAIADLALPVTLYHTPLWMGLQLRAASSFYIGDNRYADPFGSGARTYADAAFRVTF